MLHHILHISLFFINSTTTILTVTFLAHHKIAPSSSKEHGESTPYVIRKIQTVEYTIPTTSIPSTKIKDIARLDNVSCDISHHLSNCSGAASYAIDRLTASCTCV